MSAKGQIPTSLSAGNRSALNRLESSGQHRYAGEHDFGSLYPEARLFQGGLYVIWRKTDRIRIVQHASEQVPGGKGRLLASVVDHEIMHKDQAVRRKRIERAACKDGNVVFADSAPHIGHENNIVTFGPIRCDGVSGQMPNTVGQSGLPRILPGRLDCLRKIENGCPEQRVCRAKGKSVSPAASANVE